MTHRLVEACTTPCNNLSSMCWHTVPCWCIGTLLGSCLIVGWSPVSMQCCTIPVCPRSDSPDKKISVNSSKMLVSSFLCELLRFRAPVRTVWTLRASFVSAFYLQAGCDWLFQRTIFQLAEGYQQRSGHEINFFGKEPSGS